MTMRERIHSVLVVSATTTMNTVLSSFLTEGHYEPVKYVQSVSEGKRAWAEQAYDYVIVNSPMPDDTGVGFAIDIASSQGTVVLLLVKAQIYEDIFNKVVKQGVFVLPKPTNRGVLSQALDWMESAHEYGKKLERKTVSVEEKMKEIRLVNRAKWLLITKEKLDEPTAHRFIEKQAMNHSMSKREVAEEIIRKYE